MLMAYQILSLVEFIVIAGLAVALIFYKSYYDQKRKNARALSALKTPEEKAAYLLSELR